MKRLSGFCVLLVFFVGLGLSYVSAKGVVLPAEKKEVVVSSKEDKKMPTKKTVKAAPALGQEAPYVRAAFLKLQRHGKIIAPDGSELKIITEKELKKFRDIP
ncbi:MAG: hypothetical protein QME07_01660 [bacterium]|nr:hypothetical protein [bacterium]